MLATAAERLGKPKIADGSAMSDNSPALIFPFGSERWMKDWIISWTAVRPCDRGSDRRSYLGWWSLRASWDQSVEDLRGGTSLWVFMWPLPCLRCLPCLGTPARHHRVIRQRSRLYVSFGIFSVFSVSKTVFSAALLTFLSSAGFYA